MKLKYSLLIIFFVFILFFDIDAQQLNVSGSTLNTGNVAVHNMPNLFMIIPFIALLLMIATGPLFYKHFWEKNYPKVSFFLGLIVVLYYLFVLNDYHYFVHTMAEYISFIALLSSLFIVSGGILIKVDKKATPINNVLLLFFGAIISNLVGTTGASMLLIRPFIRMNRFRIKPYHIIFFIFIISNVGGALTPIGDPPLFLGFLRGVPFFWVIKNVWFIWLIAVLLILFVFFLYDFSNKKGEQVQNEYSNKIELKGLKNFIFLGIILFAVFLDPGVISWIPSLNPLPFGIREIVMFAVCYFSYKLSEKEILKANEFEFEPIKEVAYLFIGIFLTMMPALQIIAYESKMFSNYLNHETFYWATGTLSSFLDNAPTYLTFLSAAMGKFALNINLKTDVAAFVNIDSIYCKAISVGAVFFGAVTYIGNGPNFMVKSISERAGIEMPSFFTYMIKYSIPILLPIFTLVWYLFFS